MAYYYRKLTNPLSERLNYTFCFLIHFHLTASSFINLFQSLITATYCLRKCNIIVHIDAIDNSNGLTNAGFVFNVF